MESSPQTAEPRPEAPARPSAAIRKRRRNPRGQGARLTEDIVAGALALIERTGSAEAVTLRAVARWADHWDMVGAAGIDDWLRASEVLDGHCADIGRDPAQILKSVHLMWAADADPAELADRAAMFADAGVDLVIFSMRGPYEVRLLEPLAKALH